MQRLLLRCVCVCACVHVRAKFNITSPIHIIWGGGVKKHSSKNKKGWGGRTPAVQEFWLQTYLLLFLRTAPSGDKLAYLFTDCALASGCRFAFSLIVNA
jgi:hypothetical protein